MKACEKLIHESMKAYEKLIHESMKAYGKLIHESASTSECMKEKCVNTLRLHLNENVYMG